MSIQQTLHLNTPFQELQLSEFAQKKVTFYLKRDDLIHPFISGNKWRKLVANIEHIKDRDVHTLATYGGAYSNHILATAFAASSIGLKSIGYIRGTELSPRSNYMLKIAQQMGMDLRFISRAEYKEKAHLHHPSENGIYYIPQGGANELGSKGCQSILDNAPPIEHIVVASGTGTTAIGLGQALKKDQHLHIIDCVGHDPSVKISIRNNLPSELFTYYGEYTFGGFGQYPASLLNFSKSFGSQTGVLLDPIYTAKMLYACYDLLTKKVFKEGQSIAAIHTGGLTGILSEKWLKT
jgi:1-aminocyclopropane-1-carboxylate deaminase